MRVTSDYVETINSRGVTFKVDSQQQPICAGRVRIDFCCNPLLPQEVVVVVTLPLQHPESEADMLPCLIVLEATDGTHSVRGHVVKTDDIGVVKLEARDQVEYRLVASH